MTTSVSWRWGGLMAAASVAAVLAGAGAQAESLGDALVSAYRNSNLLEQNRAVLRAADEDVAQAVSTLRPVLSWLALGQHVDAPNGAEQSSALLRLTLDWEISGFGRRRLDVEAAKEAVLATRQALLEVEQTVLLDAATIYMDVRRADATVGLNRTSVELVSGQLDAAKDRFEVGAITRTDVSLAEARLAAARAALAAAEGDAAASRAAYKARIGHDADGKTALPRPPALPASLDEAIAIANRLHPVIRQSQHAARVADLQVERAAADRRPSLTGNLRADTNDQGEEQGVATLQLSQTIYSGGGLSAQHRKAIANRDAARAELLQASVRVGEAVARAWSGIEVAQARISAIDRQIEAANAAYEGVVEEASLGARTTLDVLDAEQNVLEAKTDRANAEAEYQVAIYSLLASMGLLTVENLKLGIPVYDPEAYYDAVKSAPTTSVQGSSLDRVLKAIGKN